MTASSQVFIEAVAAYEAQHFERAQHLCRDILKDTPDHAACLHLMGVIEFKLGHVTEAEILVRKSLALNSNFAEMHFSFSQILMAQGKYDEALMTYRRVLELKPQHAGALNALGVLLCEQRQFTEAAHCFEQLILIRPNYPEALNNLAVVCHDTGRFSNAVEYCQRALNFQPDYIAALVNLGNAYRALGNGVEAIKCYERVLQLNPSVIEARNNMGLALLHLSSKAEDAAICFERILAQNPNHAPALTHLGITLCHRGRFDEGIKCYEKALIVQPGYRDALNNMGNALRALGKMNEAIEAYRHVVDAQPYDSEGHSNLAMCLLAAGQFEEGWREYEWRWQTTQLAVGKRSFLQPQWSGDEAVGRILLIHAEQGFGDTLQFCRYVPLAAARGLKIVLEVQPQLVRLLASLSGINTVIARGDPLPHFDMHCPMMSLPHALGIQIGDISFPYLAATEADILVWGERLKASKRFKVGLVWAGNPRLFSIDLADANRRRSLSPETLIPLLNIPHIEFYSLQKDGPELPDHLKLIDCMPLCHDFADTAALIAQLDLVISVDTAVVHLAAALGKPVWVLNRYDSCWRWLHQRTDSPWYPNLRIFRQNVPGDWHHVIDSVRDALLLYTRSS